MFSTLKIKGSQRALIIGSFSLMNDLLAFGFALGGRLYLNVSHAI